MSVEAAATSVLQEAIADDVRATVLGLNDSVIIGAALVGSLLAPVSVELVGGGPALGIIALGLALAAGWARTSTPAPATTSGLPSGVSRQEAHEETRSGATSTPGVPRVPAQRTPADDHRLHDVEERGHPAGRSR